MNLFTADQHFDHENIIEYCRRPFKNVSEMNRVIIDKHNSRVSPADTVYFIGDFTLSKNYHLVNRLVNKLNGRKILILGSHEDFRPFTYISMGFESVHTSLEVNGMILNHDYVVSYVNRSKIFLCGHAHDLFLVQKNVINVGVDVWDFYPVSESQIEEKRFAMGM